MITSEQNPRIKELARLFRSSRKRRETGLFVVEGVKMVGEAFRGNRLAKLYLSQSYHESGGGERYQGVECEVVKDSLFQRIGETVTPQGALGLARMSGYSWEDVAQGAAGRLLVLENLSDPGNLGTIIRTAEGAGFQGIVMSKDTVDAYNPKVVRATMGSLFRVPFLYVEDFGGAMQRLKEGGYVTYAADLQGERVYDQLEYARKTAIFIGNEANGLTPAALDSVRHRVRIPMAGEVESLNAAVAAALLMYEVARIRPRRSWD